MPVGKIRKKKIFYKVFCCDEVSTLHPVNIIECIAIKVSNFYCYVLSRFSLVFFLCGYFKFNKIRLLSHDVTSSMLLSQNNEKAAMLVIQTNPLGIKFFSYVETFLLFQEICIAAGHVSERRDTTHFDSEDAQVVEISETVNNITVLFRTTFTRTIILNIL